MMDVSCDATCGSLWVASHDLLLISTPDGFAPGDRLDVRGGDVMLFVGWHETMQGVGVFLIGGSFVITSLNGMSAHIKRVDAAC